MNWYFTALKKYAVFSGRASRAEFWYFTLFYLIIGVVLAVVDFKLGVFSQEMNLGLLSGVYTLAMLVPSIAVTVRRLHDINHSGWWFLLMLIPVLGTVILFCGMILDGEAEQNQYGESPKRAIV